MKKIMILLIVSLVVLSSCSQAEKLPNFVGQKINDALSWKVGKNVEIVTKSEFSSTVDENIVISQDVTAGERITDEMVITILYSRGIDPSTPVILPEMIGMSRESIEAWFIENKVRNYSFIDVFSDEVEEGVFIDIDVPSSTEGEGYMAKDVYNIYISKGSLVPEMLKLSERKVRGVNLGGWFVLEGWMSPELFEGVSGSDETVFMQQKPNAMEEMRTHYKTFIVETDFEWLSQKGVDYVRLPIPWWLYGETAYEGTDLEVTYSRSVEYIDQAMDWAAKHEIDVLLDLHTAPGCQNGFDNGGIQGVREWGNDEEVNGYVSKTIDILERITNRYKEHKAFYGIELLNEPSWDVDLEILQEFYLESYSRIRELDQDVKVVMHDGFRSYMTDKWLPFFKENGLENVIFDLHLYSVFSNELSEYSLEEHLDHVTNGYGATFDSYEGVVPIVIGEWSLALPNYAKQGLDEASKKLATIAYGNREMNVFDQVEGWFFWSYKIDRQSHLEWDFRRLSDQGYFPDNLD
jgi:glucan 1,3-beta-glucosidase